MKFEDKYALKKLSASYHPFFFSKTEEGKNKYTCWFLQTCTAVSCCEKQTQISSKVLEEGALKAFFGSKVKSA